MRTIQTVLRGLFLPILMLVGMGCGDTSSEKPFDEATQHAIEAAVSAQLARYGGNASVPGAIVAVWAPGRGTYTKGIGVADLATGRGPALEDKVRVGSNTKTFTVTVLLQLVDEGKLSLDDTLSRFDVGVTMPNADRITVRQLCNMTSGLGEYLHSPEIPLPVLPETYFDPHYLAVIASHLPPLSAPGERWNYCNTNYLMLGLILEAVTGNRAEDEIRRRLIEPYGLTDTTFPTRDPNISVPYMHGYSLDERGEWVDSTVRFPPSLTWTAGAMLSSLQDLKRWVKIYVSGDTNSAATQRERLTCIPAESFDMERFGLGVACSGDWRGYTGSIEGYNSAVYYLPAEDATMIVLVNSQQEDPWPGVANAVVHEISKIVFPEHLIYAEPAPAARS